MIKTIVLATGNKGKCREMAAYLEIYGVELIPQTDFFTESVEETGTTFIENAIIKARYAAQKTGLPALADDSGLVVAALGGEPGILSARYAGDDATDEMRNELLLKNLDALGGVDRSAYFACALAFFTSAADPMPIIACGQWQGSILKAPKGDQGFGYDPVFKVGEKSCSAAELTATEKHHISHRGVAMQGLLGQLPAVLVEE